MMPVFGTGADSRLNLRRSSRSGPTLGASHSEGRTPGRSASDSAPDQWARWFSRVEAGNCCLIYRASREHCLQGPRLIPLVPPRWDRAGLLDEGQMVRWVVLLM